MCDKKAEFVISDGPRPDDEVFACADHVGHLLQDCVSKVQPVGSDDAGAMCCFLGPAESEDSNAR